MKQSSEIDERLLATLYRDQLLPLGETSEPLYSSSHGVTSLQGHVDGQEWGTNLNICRFCSSAPNLVDPLIPGSEYSGTHYRELSRDVSGRPPQFSLTQGLHSVPINIIDTANVVSGGVYCSRQLAVQAAATSPVRPRVSSEQGISAIPVNIVGIADPHPGMRLGFVRNAKPRPTARNLVFGFTVQEPNATAAAVDPLSVAMVAAALRADSVEKKLNAKIESAFSVAESIRFEDGMENDFTLALSEIIHESSNRAVKKIGARALDTDIRNEVVAQTLLFLGRAESAGTVQERSRILRQGLFSPSAKVRDAASIGLLSIGDKASKSYLEAAIEKENIPSLKKDMEQVLAELQSLE